ncbi:fumarate hydratase [Methanobrevibacter boviskoreani]|uniref:fumarate hydratase n=1 Tax=Methanobrevibacter boviskoreani TaxID=1348249 RepID=UPI000592DAF4|nr:fumarate hydratase [Methanobrevibacter boviskoreani]MCI6774785.1 fumarate hydratase [Methanobrevibacter boviskoreani]MCI6931369.1 fumarate hydratase [Methanobrevibacter boviskoreani]MDD6256103.1 fumarate hydratase [Methanobrevibacter boviskoreani]MDY5615084.1 fumarate hydratase [Methanobrevibacter boviskoreani]
MISEKTIEDTVYQLYKKAAIDLNEDVVKSLEDALENEEDELAKLNISNILKNIELAHKNQIPMCQDTGLGVIFVKLGNVEVENLKEGIEKGVRKATKEVPLRPNIVDPITRENSGDNTGVYIPYISIELTDTDYLEITVLPKGFGSENNNKLKMALPAEGKEGIKDFVIESVLAAGGKPCPPMVVGVGIGGTSDLAMKLAKEALIEKVGQPNPDDELNQMENEILERINKNGKGPMGLGGKTTALDVKIKKASTHTAGLPIGVCIQCWANRHATSILKDE